MISVAEARERILRTLEPMPPEQVPLGDGLGRVLACNLASRRTQPQPSVTISVWPSGCVCQAVRAPGSKVTFAAATRAGSGGLISGSSRTLPVK